MKISYKALTIGRFIITTNKSMENAKFEIDLKDFLVMYDKVKDYLKKHPELLEEATK